MKNYQKLESFSRGSNHPRDVSGDMLHWENISVKKKYPKSQGIFRKTSYEQVQLLDNVNGYARTGSLMALMGSSGSGKTTLLASISRRLTDGFYGDIYLNGDKIGKSQMTRISGFVPQTYLAMEYFTVYEHLNFMARLKMDRRTPEIDRILKISDLLGKFTLYSCRFTLLSKISGGERKRLSIATEMLTDPHILFCDEPTTGLDSWNASNVISILRQFCSQDKIVICSIHQPASGVFDLFDDVLLLATGGRVAYFGPVNETVGYFASLQYECPLSYNLAEFIINTVSISPRRDKEQVTAICDSYEASEQAIRAKNIIESAYSDELKSSKFSSSSIDSRIDKMTDSIERIDVFTQTILLIGRSFTKFRRDYKNNLINYMVYTCIAIVNVLPFPRILHTTDHVRWQNIRGYLSLFSLDGNHQPIHRALDSALDRLPYQEIASGLYSVQAHYLRSIICVACSSLLSSVVFITIAKNLSDCFDYFSYLHMIVVFYIFVMSAMTMGYAISAVCDTPMMSFLFVHTYGIVNHMLGGIYTNISGRSLFANYAKYLFTMYYTFQAIMVMEWKTIDIVDMKQSNISFNDPTAFPHLKILAQQGFAIYDYKYNLYILIGFIIVCLCISYIFVTRKSRNYAVY